MSQTSHRFGHSRQKPNYLIAAADVYENLTTICCQKSGIDDLTTNSSQILPTNEGQVRPMTKLEPQEQWEVWQTVSNSHFEKKSEKILLFK